MKTTGGNGTTGNGEIQMLLGRNKNLEAKMDGDAITLSGTSGAPKAKGLFETKVLTFLLREMDSFNSVILLGKKSAIIYGSSLYAIAGAAVQPLLDPDEFSLILDDIKFGVFVGPLNPTPSAILSQYKPSTRFDKINQLETAPMLTMTDDGSTITPGKTLTKSHSRTVWDAMLCALLLSHFDENSVISTTPFPGWPTRVPTLSAGENYIIRITLPSDRTDSALTLLRNEWERILNQVIFEYYRTRGIMLQLTSLFSKGMKDSDLGTGRLSASFPGEIPFRPIDPFLLEYVRVAETTNHTNFRYLSYYHVLEYFFIPVAIENISREIGKIVLDTDFLRRPKHHTERLVRVIGTKIPDRIKDEEALRLVLIRFLPQDFADQIPKGIMKHIRGKTEFDGNLTLDGANPEGGYFIAELTKRIYRLRCAIVHSKADFEEGRGHVLSSERNTKLILKETELLRSIAETVIIQSGFYSEDQKSLHYEDIARQ